VHLGVSTRIIAEHPLVEIAEARDLNTRVWQRVKEVEITYPDGRKETDTIISRVLEKGSGICYRDAWGQLLPSVPQWEITATAFAVERCVYGLYAGPTLATPVSYVVQGRELLFTPAALVVSDGEREAIIATVNREVMGRIDDDDPSRLVYVGAFGPGVDIEFAVEPAAIHQNLVIWREIGLPEGIDPARARLRVLTELDLEAYAEQGVSLYLGDKRVDLGAGDLSTAQSRHGAIRFAQMVGAKDVALHSFVESPIGDAGGSGDTLFAHRRLYRNPETRKTYLEESVAYSQLSESRFPVVWDWVSAQNVPADETDEWTPKDTVYVSSNISVYGTLIIRPGTTVKIASDKKIEVQSGGCVRAVGEPYNFITITSKNDDHSGEDLTPGTTSGQAGDYQYALRLLDGCSASSAIQHCKIGYAETGVEDNVSLVTDIRDNVIRDVENYGIHLGQDVSTNCRNNLLVECGDDGIYCDVSTSCDLASNTIDSCTDGIHTSGSDNMVIERNLLTRNTVGIRSVDDTDCTYDYNGFWRNSDNFVGVDQEQQGSNNQELGWDEDPYKVSTLGNFFLDTGGYGGDLSEGGASATHARLAAEWYSVEAPVYKAGIQDPLEDETWSKKTTYGPNDTVYIGYHHSRVDFDANYIFLNGTLTIEAGVVVCVTDWGHLVVALDGDLQCVGDPEGGGYILFCGGQAVSMRIESHPWPPPSAAGQNTLSGPGPPGRYSSIKFTRFQWLYGGFNVWQDLGDNNLEHNVFSLCNWGIDVDAQIDLEAKSDLFAMNHRGVMMWGWTSRATRSLYNCTFDDNDCGLRFSDYDNLMLKDSLFTNNDYGASQYHNYGGGTFVHEYNGFYNNTHDLYDEQSQEDMDLGDNAKELEESPYDPHGAYAERFYLIQHNNSLIDGGSRNATQAGLSNYTTSLGSREDVGTSYVDIGYHYPLRLKPYLQKLATDKITIMWHTSTGGTGYVEWGPTENYGYLESGSATTLGTLRIYEERLTGLQPDTLYHYRVKHGSDYSPDNTFRTAMSTGDSFRFIAYGDNRGGTESPPEFREEHLKVVNAMLAHAWTDAEPRFILHCGDFVHDGGTVVQWHPHFFDPAAGLLRSTPLWPCLGNHEYYGTSPLDRYRKLFSVYTAHKNYSERFYSFDYANCHFIVLDTGQNALASYIGGGTDQYTWLVSDISSVDREQVDWVIVLLHIPPYTDSSSHPYGGPDPEDQNDVWRVRTYLAPVFEDPDHPADLVISGHNHFYERSQAGEGEEPEHWVHYIVTGGGGAGLHTPGGNNPERVLADESRHFCIIDIDETTATVNVIDDDGDTIEQDVELHPGEEWTP